MLWLVYVIDDLGFLVVGNSVFFGGFVNEGFYTEDLAVLDQVELEAHIIEYWDLCIGFTLYLPLATLVFPQWDPIHVLTLHFAEQWVVQIWCALSQPRLHLSLIEVVFRLLLTFNQVGDSFSDQLPRAVNSLQISLNFFAHAAEFLNYSFIINHNLVLHYSVHDYYYCIFFHHNLSTLFIYPLRN